MLPCLQEPSCSLVHPVTSKPAVGERCGGGGSCRPTRPLPYRAGQCPIPSVPMVALHGLFLLGWVPLAMAMPTTSDQSVRGYLTERTCWWNEICKEEFQTQFKCKCPMWSFCRSEGRYYSAYCSMANTGYIWTQPERTWSPAPRQPASLKH